MRYTITSAGNFRVQPMIKGKRYSLTFPHIPSDKDILLAVMEIEREKPAEEVNQGEIGVTFEHAIQDYLELKIDRLAPSTAREYNRLDHNFSQSFCRKDIGLITQLDVDREIAAWLKRKLSYKTMKNYYSMMCTVIKKFRPDFSANPDMLPERPRKKDVYIPTANEVAVLLNWFKHNDDQFYIPFWISIYGLRRGEVCALTVDDIEEDGTIHVTKDIVQNDRNEWIVKQPKTAASVRDVGTCKELYEEIMKKGYVYKGNPHSINKALSRAQVECGINHFSLHKMRHYCCTELFDMGCSEVDVMAYMGWEDESDVMRQVYLHSRLKNDKERILSLSEKLTKRSCNFVTG